MTFRFRSGEDLFVLKGNEQELDRLYAQIDQYRTQIDEGAMPIYVDGYCASRPTVKENLHTAFIRANRVKSELIVQKGLKETDFITANYTTPYDGNKDVVVVTIRIPAASEQPQPAVKEEPQPEPRIEPEPEPQPAVKAEPSETVLTPASMEAPEPVVSRRGGPYRFAVRTNVLYDAFLLPTLGVEWRINSDIGFKLDGSLARWGDEHGKVQKMWLLNPELRWYLLRNKRLYAGLSGCYGKANIYKYMMGSVLSKNTGYQGSFWNAGLTVGYQLYLSRNFSLDFNLGLGYTRFDYDSFGIIDGVRIYKGKDQSKNLWGPTQAGITLIWTIGNHK